MSDDTANPVESHWLPFDESVDSYIIINVRGVPCLSNSARAIFCRTVDEFVLELLYETGLLG